MYEYAKHQLLKMPKIFGRRLKPLSLGHIDLFYAMEHACLRTAELSIADLVSAVWICSHTHGDASEKIRTGRNLSEIRQISRRLAFFDISSAGVAFGEYFDLFIQGPERYESDKTERLRSPWHLSVFMALQEKTNFSPAETWDLPLPRAFEFCAAAAANNGDESLVPPDEYEIRELIKQGV